MGLLAFPSGCWWFGDPHVETGFRLGPLTADQATRVRDHFAKFEAAAGGARLNAVIVTADPATGRATGIERLNLSASDVETLAESRHAATRR